MLACALVPLLRHDRRYAAQDPEQNLHIADTRAGISSSTVAGSALILPHEIYNAKATLACIEKYKCTAVYGVPTMFVTEMETKEFEQTDRFV